MKLQPPRQLLKQLFKGKWLLGSLLGISILFGTAPVTRAQVAEPDTSEFRRIEQPLGLKIGVVAAGAGLIGLELWWFLFSRTKAQTAQFSEGVQSVDISTSGDRPY